MSKIGDDDETEELSDSARECRPGDSARLELRPFVGRSRGVMTATREDLLAPIGENWEVVGDL